MLKFAKQQLMGLSKAGVGLPFDHKQPIGTLHPVDKRNLGTVDEGVERQREGAVVSQREVASGCQEPVPTRQPATERGKPAGSQASVKATSRTTGK